MAPAFAGQRGELHKGGLREDLDSITLKIHKKPDLLTRITR